MPYLPLQGPNHLQLKFYSIMLDFKHVLDFNPIYAGGGGKFAPLPGFFNVAPKQKFFLL